MLFDMPLNTLLPRIPTPSEKLTAKMNAAFPTFDQTYLDNFPFGNFIPLRSKPLVPALILSAQLHFIFAATVLYALLSGVMFYLFRRTVARSFTITGVLSATQETDPHTLMHIVAEPLPPWLSALPLLEVAWMVQKQRLGSIQ
jgi:hypothetical protein